MIMVKNIFNRLTDWSDYFKSGALLGVAGLTLLLIRNVQNKETKALQYKLDELIAAGKKNNPIIDIDHLTADELNQLQQFCEKLEQQRRKKMIAQNNDLEEYKTYYRYK